MREGGAMKVEPGYEILADVLQMALDQAQTGKGKERHSDSRPFQNQTIMETTRAHGIGFALGQAEKKGRESYRLPTKDAKVRELLGAINYTAAAIIRINEE